MDIREISSEDYEEFCKIIKNFFEYSGDKSENYNYEALFEKVLSPESNIIFIGAFFDKEIGGVLSLTFGESTYKLSPFAWCDDFYVKEKYRGQGIGKKLIIKAKELAGERNCSNILLAVGQDETDSQRFYKSSGFLDMNCKLMTLPLL